MSEKHIGRRRPDLVNAAARLPRRVRQEEKVVGVGHVEGLFPEAGDLLRIVAGGAGPDRASGQVERPLKVREAIPRPVGGRVRLASQREPLAGRVERGAVDRPAEAAEDMPRGATERVPDVHLAQHVGAGGQRAIGAERGGGDHVAVIAIGRARLDCVARKGRPIVIRAPPCPNRPPTSPPASAAQGSGARREEPTLSCSSASFERFGNRIDPATGDGRSRRDHGRPAAS